MTIRGLLHGAAATLALAGTLAACSSTTGPAPPRPTPPAVTNSTNPVATSSGRLRCEQSIDAVDDLPDGYAAVAGAVAVATGELEPAPTSAEDPRRMFAKTGLLVRAGRSAELTLLSTSARPALMGWGTPAGSWAATLTIPACPEPPGGETWLAYPGGFLVDQPGCLRLDVDAEQAEETARIAVGAAC